MWIRVALPQIKSDSIQRSIIVCQSRHLYYCISYNNSRPINYAIEFRLVVRWTNSVYPILYEHTFTVLPINLQ